jgi:hypothetical protein
LFNVRFFRDVAGLHAGLVGAPFRRALFRGLCEGWCSGDAPCDRSGDKQTITDFHIHSPDLLPC